MGEALVVVAGVLFLIAGITQDATLVIYGGVALIVGALMIAVAGKKEMG